MSLSSPLTFLRNRLKEEAFPLWRALNKELGEELFHETGLLMLSRAMVEYDNPKLRKVDFSAGSFPFASLVELTNENHCGRYKNEDIRKILRC